MVKKNGNFARTKSNCSTFTTKKYNLFLNMMSSLTAALLTIGLLVISNTFLTFAWYGHLKLQTAGISTHWPLVVVILVSWGIALLEYCFMVPANRIGFVENGGPFSLMQLKIIQEVITLSVFTIFVIVFFKGESLHWNHFVAFVLLIAAVGFAFLDTSKM